jgi:hypothetical protein
MYLFDIEAELVLHFRKKKMVGQKHYMLFYVDTSAKYGRNFNSP